MHRNSSYRTILWIVAPVLFSCISVAQFPAVVSNWSLKEEPVARNSHSAVYDSNSRRMIVFGGQSVVGLNNVITNSHQNDVWYLTNANNTGAGTAWLPANPSGTPPTPRLGHTAVYNGTSNRMVVFGGAGGFANPCFNDVWVLSNANGVGGNPTWTQSSPSGAPPKVRFAHSVVYDAANDIMVIFGGVDCAAQTLLNDVYLLKNATSATPAWVQLSVTGQIPGIRDYHTAVYNSATNQMIVFGGSDVNSKPLLDIYILSNANGLQGSQGSWANASISGPAVWAHVAVYDQGHDRMTIFGGIGSQGFVDVKTWLLTDATKATRSWTLLVNGNNLPTRRFLHSAVLDPVKNRMIVFGGQMSTDNGVNIFLSDDVFVLTHPFGL